MYMKKHPKTKAIGLTLLSLLSVSKVSLATADLPDLKPVGISLDLYHQSLDLDVDSIKADSRLGLTPEMLEAFTPQLNTSNEIDFYGLRLDYQITPSFNLFGSIGKAEEKTTVDFSNVNPALSDLSLDKKGNIYSVGATYTKNFSPLIASVTLTHSLIDLDDNPHDITVSGIIPSLGYKTRIGVITGNLIYQEVDAVLSGEITAPFVGAVPIEVNASSDGEIKVVLGLQTRLANDFYLNANAGVGGHEQYQIQLNKRF